MPPALPEVLPEIQVKAEAVLPLRPPLQPLANNEYLPPIDVRSGFLPTWEEWKVCMLNE